MHQFSELFSYNEPLLLILNIYLKNLREITPGHQQCCSPNRVDEDVGSEVSVRGCMALEADGNHVEVAGLEPERQRHLDEPVRSFTLLVRAGEKSM